ncbi:hypothetical protein BKI52_40810 [marine bacterium AO1-C]|nr:hypothetical protein BKI52_40810 [marine bacterium AO1-C]
MALNYNFIQILDAGKLALSQRPKVKEIKDLVSADCDRVVTILSVKDRPQNIGVEAEACGMQWHWLKVANAGKITDQEHLLFKSMVHTIYDAILDNQSVLVHCSAGLHRTGMFAYALLRQANLDREEALEIIKQMRPATQEALEEKYLSLAEGLY